MTWKVLKIYLENYVITGYEILEVKSEKKNKYILILKTLWKEGNFEKNHITKRKQAYGVVLLYCNPKSF